MPSKNKALDLVLSFGGKKKDKKEEFLLSIPEAGVIAVPRKYNAGYVMEKWTGIGREDFMHDG